MKMFKRILSQTWNLMVTSWYLMIALLSCGQLVQNFHGRGITLLVYLVPELMLVSHVIHFSSFNCFYGRVAVNHCQRKSCKDSHTGFQDIRFPRSFLFEQRDGHKMIN